jgi:PEP-CTERM motif-containing protein
MKLLDLRYTASTLAAAIALAFAGHAAAAIDAGTGGNGELFLSVWNTQGTDDTADDTSFTLDLGQRLSTWASAANPPSLDASKTAPGTLLSFNAAALLNFLSGTTSGDIFWNVSGLDSSGPRRALTTGKSAPTLTNLTLTNAISNGQTYLAGANSLGTHGTDVNVNGSNTATAADGTAFANSGVWGKDFGGRLTGFDNTGNLGDSLSFYLLSTTGTSTSSQTGARVSQFASPAGIAATWKLTQDGLTYSVTAVPEPGTWAMLAAGLLAVGAIARRRAV